MKNFHAAFVVRG